MSIASMSSTTLLTIILSLQILGTADAKAEARKSGFFSGRGTGHGEWNWGGRDQDMRRNSPGHYQRSQSEMCGGGERAEVIRQVLLADIAAARKNNGKLGESTSKKLYEKQLQMEVPYYNVLGSPHLVGNKIKITLGAAENVATVPQYTFVFTVNDDGSLQHKDTVGCD